jgi:4-amino-4-deoxy-L-arabinose transferase-like glycosyltransferase
MNTKQARFQLCAGAALVAGLLLRLWFIRYLAVVQGDTLVYGAIARNWLQTGVYGFGHQTTAAGLTVVRPTLIRLPGYPLFLAVCFRLFGMENYRAVLYVQAVADLLTCWLAAALAGRLFGRRALLPVLWLAALCPFTANYVAAPLTETLVLTTIALAFYAFARWQDAGLGFNPWLWVIGFALAYSLLLRPDQGLLAAAVVPAMLWRSLAAREPSRPLLRATLPTLAAALCTALPLIPWTARNWSTFHVFQPLAPRYANDPGEPPPLGFARWYRTWAIDFASTDQVYWNYNGDQIQLTNLPPRAFDLGSPAASQDLRDRTAALLADYNATTTSTPAIDARFAALASERVHAHPILYYLGLPVARLLDMVLRPRIEMMPIPDEWWHWKPRPAQIFSAAYAALNLVYFALGCAGFCLWLRRTRLSSGGPFRELVLAMAASLLLRCALLLTLDNAEPRYTLEFFPILFVWAGALFARNREPNPCTTP